MVLHDWLLGREKKGKRMVDTGALIFPPEMPEAEVKYLSVLGEQIRCQKARPMIMEEIKNHIEDQAQAFEQEGQKRAKAYEQAVRQMGDPVEAGTALDRIHRPKTDWGMIGIVLILTIVGIVIQGILFTHVQDNDSVQQTYLFKTIAYNILGLSVMAVVYFLDYTILSKKPLWLLSGMMLTGILIGMSAYGSMGTYYISYQRGRTFIYAFFTLIVPVFAGVLYKMRGRGLRGLLLCGLLCVLPLFLELRMCLSTGMLELMICFLFLLTVAICKGWFGKWKAGKLILVWFLPVAIPGAVLADIFWLNGKLLLLAEYQMMRIKAILQPMKYRADASYMLITVRQLTSEFTLFGRQEISGRIPDVYNDYVVASLFSYFGILAGAAVLGLVFLLVMKSFRIGFKQKNQLGFIVALGCSMSLVTKVVVYVLANFGLSVFSQMTMPFLSFGLSNTLVNSVMMGLLLSVYRYTDIIPCGNRAVSS